MASDFGQFHNEVRIGDFGWYGDELLVVTRFSDEQGWPVHDHPKGGYVLKSPFYRQVREQSDGE